MFREFETVSLLAFSAALASVLLAAGGCIPIGRDRNLMSESCRGPYDACVASCSTGKQYDVKCVNRCGGEADRCRALSR